MKVAEVMKALSDESRIRIAALLTKKELCVCEIEAILNMSQSNVSRYLLKLKNAGIVDAKRESQWIYYSVNETFKKENDALIDYLQHIADCEPLFQVDRKKLDGYMSSGMNCEQLTASVKISTGREHHE